MTTSLYSHPETLTPMACIICLDRKVDANNRCGTCRAGVLCNSCFTQYLQTSVLSFDGDFKYTCPICRAENGIPCTMHSPEMKKIFLSVSARTSSCSGDNCIQKLAAILARYPYLSTMVDDRGGTLMHIAAFFGNTRAMEIIHQNGGSFLVHCEDNLTPLDFLREYEE